MGKTSSVQARRSDIIVPAPSSALPSGRNWWAMAAAVSPSRRLDAGFTIAGP